MVVVGGVARIRTGKEEEHTCVAQTWVRRECRRAAVDERRDGRVLVLVLGLGSGDDQLPISARRRRSGKQKTPEDSTCLQMSPRADSAGRVCVKRVVVEERT